MGRYGSWIGLWNDPADEASDFWRRAVVNHDDCEFTAPDPLVWSAGALPRGAGLSMLCATTLCCLTQLFFGPLIGSVFLLCYFC